MSLSTSFGYLSFQRKVQDALQSVERTLELERKPKLAGDIDHTYGAKYGLVNLTSNAAIIAYMNCFEKLGLDVNVFKSIDKTKPATIRFNSASSSRFLKEVIVDVPVPVGRSYHGTLVTTESDPSQSTTKTRVLKAINHVTEYHWEVEVNWSISIYSGTSVFDTEVSKSRRCTTQLITRTEKGVNTKTNPPIELSLTWLMHQFDTANFASQFKVNIEDEATKTPRRNDAVDKAVEFATQIKKWCSSIYSTFIQHLQVDLLDKHYPVVPEPQQQRYTLDNLIHGAGTLFNPILPLMDETGQPDEVGGICRAVIDLNGDDRKTLLSKGDMSSFIAEHIRSLGEAFSGIEQSWPSDSSNNIIASSEAALALISTHLTNLATQYIESMSYIESMIEQQLIAAIGKRLTPKDLDKFVKYHNTRLLQPMPQPFSHAIRRPEHYPVGLLSIESEYFGEESECIHSHSREVDTSSNLKISLSAATVLELTGQQYLHGYMNHRFGSSHKSHTDGSTLDPKDAIIVQNKDELIIPLLLEELPTAKEFKDAIKSLSPEQQRFARAYRKMQLASSVFGICIVQIKPQLEVLLGLPSDALDKEMKLTQDLMELFIEYQVPSDLLSYNGISEGVATEDMISNVRDNVKNVMDVVEAEKNKQLKAEQAKTEMAMEKTVQGFGYGSPPAAGGTFGAPARASGGFGSAPSPFGSPAFGSPAPPPEAGGLFGAPAPPPDGGLFGAPAPTTLLSAPAPATGQLLKSAQSGRTFESQQQQQCVMPPVDRGLSGQAESGPSSFTPDAAASTKIAADKMQNQGHAEEEGKKSKVSNESHAPKHASDQGLNFALIPQILDSAVEKNGDGNALRTTIIKTGGNWTRNRQENLLSPPKKQQLNTEEVKREKNKAFDLLDALSRSGSLPIDYSELHVIIAVTHCFDKDVMSTVICDNVNPIEKLECSTLLLASTMHGVPAGELIKDANELERLEGMLPLLLGASDSSG